jgi:hypothetical protein
VRAHRQPESPQLERRAAHLLSHVNRVAMASQIVSEGTGPLYRPRRRGDLRDRVAEVLAALRGTL